MVLILTICGVIGASQLHLDMSFRPLFVENDSVAQSTKAFENKLGQRSGAFIGVIIEDDERLATPFYHILTKTSLAVGSIDGVNEVRSVSDFAMVDWMNGTPVGKRIRGVGNSPENIEYAASTSTAFDPVEAARREFISRDGKSTLLLARLEAPLDDLKSRHKVIKEFKDTINSTFGANYSLHYVGVSVVEAAYARIVLMNMLKSLLLTSLAVTLFLWLIYRNWIVVCIALSGIVSAIPVGLATMNALQLSMTILSSIIPVIVLVVGIAQAVHMLNSFIHWRGKGVKQVGSVRRMFVEMGPPCFLAALTTSIGFLSLAVAGVESIRDFGIVAAISVVLVYLANMTLLPTLLSFIPIRFLYVSRAGDRWIDNLLQRINKVVSRRPDAIAFAFGLLAICCVLTLPDLTVDQRFNEEVSTQHPVRVAQSRLESNFTNMLGPELSIERVDGKALTQVSDRSALLRAEQAVRNLSATRAVYGISSYLPPERALSLPVVTSLRSDPVVGTDVRNLISADGRTAALVVRTDDIGSEQAHLFVSDIERSVRRTLGDSYRVETVGQWWLAQRGMQSIMLDMIKSFLAACLIVLPILGLSLRNRSLFLVSIIPNVLPVLFALAFMVWTGITVRVGTAMILAIAIGISVDDTIHFMYDLKRFRSSATKPGHVVSQALVHSGKAMLMTTVILVVGFLSMATHELLTLRDMGVVAAATLVIAFLADALLAPALFVLIERRDTARQRAIQVQPA